MTRKPNTQNATGNNPHILGRFSSPALAASFSARTLKASRLFMGDDMKIWVVTMAEGERLLAAGYEELR